MVVHISRAPVHIARYIPEFDSDRRTGPHVEFEIKCKRLRASIASGPTTTAHAKCVVGKNCSTSTEGDTPNCQNAPRQQEHTKKNAMVRTHNFCQRGGRAAGGRRWPVDLCLCNAIFCALSLRPIYRLRSDAATFSR